MANFTAAQVETIKRFGGSFDRINVLNVSNVREIERAYDWIIGNGMSLPYEIEFVKSVLLSLTKEEYHGRTAEELLAAYEVWLVDVSDDQWTPNAEDVRMARAWLTADPFIYFLYGYAVSETVADLAREHAHTMALRNDIPNFAQAIDEVTKDFLAIFKKAVS